MALTFSYYKNTIVSYELSIFNEILKIHFNCIAVERRISVIIIYMYTLSALYNMYELYVYIYIYIIHVRD